MDAANSCIFCRIVRGEIPARRVFESESVVAFEDLNPQAPVHVLVIPRRHVESLADPGAADPALAGDLLAAAAEVARRKGVEPTGYRVVTNVGEDGGQSVGHLHLHLIGGRRLSWPPG